jgi:hypothetical protein
MMFAVLGYQTTDADVRAALAAARRHLRRGGLLVFDVWYAPAVLRQGPSPRTKEVALAAGPLRREASGRLDRERRLCTVRYRIERPWPGSEPLAVEEAHTLRFFFREELETFLADAGFELLRLGAGADFFGSAPDESSWSMLAAARAR